MYRSSEAARAPQFPPPLGGRRRPPPRSRGTKTARTDKLAYVFACRNPRSAAQATCLPPARRPGYGYGHVGPPFE